MATLISCGQRALNLGEPHSYGQTYEPEQDHKRLTGQLM